jgi:WhiB family redox-sensing transcriptional regulator
MFNTEGAACIGLDPELFFPTNNISPKVEDLLEKTCLRCPVFDNCLDYALKV